MTNDAIQQFLPEVERRLVRAVPDASNIQLQRSSPGIIVVRFDAVDGHHAFRLRRIDGHWKVIEWSHNRELKEPLEKGDYPKFEATVACAMGMVEPTRPVSRPTIKVREMRCPNDNRRMFGKIILQIPAGGRPSPAPPHLLEFSCSVCKRENRRVTMHLFDTNGEFVRTEAQEPWIRRDPQKWFPPSQQQEVPANA